MAKKEDIYNNINETEKKNESNNKEKKYKIINRNNAPYEFMIGSNFFRLEPRGMEGDSVEITKELLEHKDTKTLLNKIIIQEGK